MKKVIIFCMLLFLLLPSAAWAADNATVATDFAALLPDAAQRMLAQGTDWQTVEFAENETGYVLLLRGSERDKTSDWPEQALYVLLQLPQNDWNAASSHLWKLSAGQGADYGALPMMQTTNDAIWLQFWDNGQCRMVYVAQNSDMREHVFSGKVDASLTEHGAVGYDESRQAFVLWDGVQEVVYPVTTPADNIRAVAELQGKVYYLDNAGTLYQVTEQTETMLDNVQQYCQGDEELALPLDYVDSLTMFYANHKLWLATNDWQLQDSYLLCYDGKQMKKTEIPAGRIHYCSMQGDGSLQLLMQDYFPTSSVQMPAEEDIILWTISQTGVQKKVCGSGDWRVALPYVDSDNLQWQYHLQDSAVQFYEKKVDGTTLGYGLDLVVPELHVTLQGQEYYFDRQPYMTNNRVLVPLRGIASLMGAEVRWWNDMVLLKTAQGEVQLRPGQRQAVVDGVALTLDVAPENCDGRVMVPLRFVAEGLQATVEWHQQQQTVEIVQ